MNVHVVLFAHAREIVGSDHIDLTLDTGATVGNLRSRLVDSYPGLAELMPRCSIAVNHEYSADDVVLSADSEIGFIPPVSGG